MQQEYGEDKARDGLYRDSFSLPLGCALIKDHARSEVAELLGCQNIGLVIE